ncbi:hypothetical protein [Novacetimonas maltaceti]|uniref:hypothetical protein n=1 Tax=Novacetimonas maltaceti TaxID=1203393 RepID=UPI00142E6493|nr:hypothetical protein [Novacetimonas maltaceti]
MKRVWPSSLRFISSTQRESETEASLISIVIVILVMVAARTTTKAPPSHAPEDTGHNRRHALRSLWNRMRAWGHGEMETQ